MSDEQPESTGRRPLVAVVGDGQLASESNKAKLAFDLGRRLIEAGYRIVCGGRAGVMEAVCRGAHAAHNYEPGATIGVLPGDNRDEANAWVDIILPTALSHARNFVVAQADAVVAIGGGAGTLSEMSFAWITDRLLIGFRVDGWSGKLADTAIDSRLRFDALDDDRVFGVDRPGQVIELLEDKLGAYRPH